MTILVIHHTLGVTDQYCTGKYKKIVSLRPGDQRRLTPQGVRNNASSVATCSSIGAVPLDDQMQRRGARHG